MDDELRVNDVFPQKQFKTRPIICINRKTLSSASIVNTKTKVIITANQKKLVEVLKEIRQKVSWLGQGNSWREVGLEYPKWTLNSSWWSIIIYIRSWITHKVWLVLTYVHLEGRRIDKVTANNIFSSMLHNTNRFHVAVCLYSYRSQKTLNYGKNISGNLYHLTTFEVICDYLRNKPTATWNLFVN